MGVYRDLSALTLDGFRMPLIRSNERAAPVEPTSSGDHLSHLVGWLESATLSAHHAMVRIAIQINS
jgi:hypothetical protein